ncbi:MAK10-like protein, partial [Tanacetum coccineum]
YSKPSHEGYRNTIELPVGNNVVPLRSNTIRLVQNGCSFYGLRSEDPNQHLKDFLKLVDSLDLDGANRERSCLRLFYFFLRDQDINWLECLPAGSITTWEDLTTRFLAQFFPPERTAKLYNDILMFQQHHGESLSEVWTHFKDLLQKVPHHGIDRWLQIQIFYDHQREEINDRMAEMFRLLKELTTSRAPKKVLIREEAKSPVTKSVNSISLIREGEEKSDKYDVATGDDSEKTDGPITEVSHRINEKLIEGLVDNNRFNDSLSGVRLGKTKGKTYNLSSRGPVYEAILKKKITKKEDNRGNFEIPCNIRGLKHVNALVDQGFDVNVMPYSTYMKLTDERPTKTDIKLSLASQSYIYPLGIAEDVLVEVAEHVYPVDFLILDIKEDKKRSFILGTPFLTTAKAVTPGMGRKDKTSSGKEDGVRPMEEQEF